MVSFDLSQEQELIRQTVRKFAMDEVKPWALENEWHPDHEARFSSKLVERANELGLKKLGLPRKYGGEPAGPLELCLVGEELGSADIGVAVSLLQCVRVAGMVVSAGSEGQKERFFEQYAKPSFLPSIAMTEPSHGSDNQLPYGEAVLNTSAKPDAEGRWVLNGQKTFITNGKEADLFLVYACTDSSAPLTEGTSCFLVDRDTPGLTTGKPMEKIARRLMSNVDLFFDNCRIPPDSLVGRRNEAFKQFLPVLAQALAVSAAITLGNARTAYESALEYAKVRVQGGKPIIEHQLVRASLAEMASSLESTRALIWRAAWAAQEKRDEALTLARMAKYLASERGFHVCTEAVQVFGGYGMLLDSPIQKYLREAVAQLHGDGTQGIQLLAIGSALGGHPE